jgi:hypothetical protein
LCSGDEREAIQLVESDDNTLRHLDVQILPEIARGNKKGVTHSEEGVIHRENRCRVVFTCCRGKQIGYESVT